MKNIIKNIIDGILSMVAFFTAAIISFAVKPSIFIALPIMIVSADRLKNVLDGNFIKNSIFSVTRDGKITQDSLKNPFRMLKIMKEKDKQKLLLNEEFKMFKQLKKYDRKGNLLIYTTVSQGLTVKLLKELNKLGYINNLSYEKVEKSDLFFEKLWIGNNKKSRNKKQIYKIKFALTDNQIDENIFNLIINPQINNNISISKKNTNNIKLSTIYKHSKQEQIEELKRLKETIIEEKQEELSKKI